MKKLIPTLLLSMVPTLVFSQARKDYERVMGKEVKFYNNGQVDSLNTLGLKDFPWDQNNLDYCMGLFGKIESFKFMEIDTTDLDKNKRKIPFAYFMAVSENELWNNKTNAMGISLDSNNSISGIRFLYKSKHTDSILTKYHYVLKEFDYPNSN